MAFAPFSLPFFKRRKAADSAPVAAPAFVPIRVPREEHSISRKQLTPGTLKVLYTLRDAGYEAYMVGGGVRDLLAGVEPKDFDIATSAHPEELRRLFRGCRLIGRRFMIAHVRVGAEIIEVTTFRGEITDSHERDETGRILSDNVYGSVETDALRRDFTINALYYDIRDFSIADFAGGMRDLAERQLRLIGDPELRYREDPVRMLRAVRIANKLKFSIAPDTAAPIARLAVLLREIPPARLFDEVMKLALSVDAVANYHGLRKHGLFLHLLPLTDESVEADPRAAALVEQTLANTAQRIANDQSVTPTFLFAALLWPAYAQRSAQLEREQGEVSQTCQTQAAEEVLAHQQLRIAIPKRFSVPMREIWALQPRFENRQTPRVKRLLAHPRFRAAFDFLALRGQAGDTQAAELAAWWQKAQTGPLSRNLVVEAAPADEPELETPAPAEPRPKKRRRRGGRGRRKGPNSAPDTGDDQAPA